MGSVFVTRGCGPGQSSSHQCRSSKRSNGRGRSASSFGVLCGSCRGAGSARGQCARGINWRDRPANQEDGAYQRTSEARKFAFLFCRGVVTCDAAVTADVWRSLVSTAVSRSFNQITVDGDTSTNDSVIALASGAAGGSVILKVNSKEAQQLQMALDAVCQGLAKSIASDGEGATVLMESAVYGRDPNWGRLACAAGYAGIAFDPNDLKISLGTFLLMEAGQPQSFDRAGASAYLKQKGDCHGTVHIDISIGSGPGHSKAWGCDLSYDYVKINAEYTT
ncbi:hypothetical protein CBR_g37471 [Chara braunii]|uniref:Uncharacterized protein n=1 Tax=Chara braunii TaxID=69332 RepID=A0A388LN23_CHABU|nr:hypothetical protein CBR_g37471 [Chara braunii]|eukprot:GBG83669.1 hypothetical protein CBR_g37471 [Chara braunii]